MPFGKKPGYAGNGSQQYWCDRCRKKRYGTIVRREMGVPGLPGADPNKVVEVGKTVRCDWCGHETTRYVDD